MSFGGRFCNHTTRSPRITARLTVLQYALIPSAMARRVSSPGALADGHPQRLSRRLALANNLNSLFYIQ
jgi:hypothetical protein